MKGTNREVVICDVGRGPEGEFQVQGELDTHETLIRETIAETQAHLVEAGWQKVGNSEIYNGRLVDVWENGQSKELISVNENVCWALWVDIEGFGSLYKDTVGSKALWALHGLMQDLYRIGAEVYPHEGERLFIHQLGDGFIVEPDFGDIDLVRPVAIGTALLRAALLRGRCLKVGIGLGTLADVKSCYPSDVMKNFENGSAPLGAGLMTIIPVMGDGLVDANKVSGRASGPLLLVRRDLQDAMQVRSVPIIPCATHVEIDWIHLELDEAERLQSALGTKGDSAKYESLMRTYLDNNPSLSDPWRKSAELLIRGY